ncbi:HNH endonuclease [Kineosporia succinea]|uniref:5-methylcytosine-specific restriction endonuclease McrA n=1 Tax=Kineosporia succinea TaxID=84632 RepID=A0ABT9PC86_9ACTN|nr:HNH endonuclease [Kineosporia succinea]MDP9830102.1 5-methylcytosine-specific restriction endonuclease McrA [Kineosporia succinea]
MSGVLVLNASYERLHYVSLPHAVRMLVRQVAVVEEAADGRPLGPWPRPKVVRLLRYVTMRWRHKTRPAWSRRGLLERDDHTCAYCGARASTVDHVLPRSHGGVDSWLNTVAACQRCNQRKRDRTPAQAGMPLRRTPFIPSWEQMLGH